MPRLTAPTAAVRRTLVTLTRSPDDAEAVLSGLSGDELEAVLRVGKAQGLGTALVASLHTAGLPVPAWLESHRFDTSTQRASLMATLAAIAPALSNTGIQWVVLKGPATAALFPSFELREFVDLDILVPGDRLPAVLGALDEVGLHAINRNWEEYLRHGVAEFPVLMMGTPVDLHWHLIGLHMTRRRFDIPIGEMLERRRKLDVGATSAFRLDAEDHALHAALHAGLSGAGRIGSLRDVHEIVRTSQLDWDELSRRARRYGAGPIVGQVLDRCRIVLGSAVPAGLPEDLTPRAALRVRRWFDERRPRQGSAPDVAFSGFIVDASRASLVRTLGRTRELLKDRLLSAAGKSPQWSGYDPDGPLYWDRPSGGPDGYERYLEFAARNA